MALKFAKKSLKQESFSKLFPLNKSKHIMQKRSPEKYVVNHTNNERYRKSAVPYLQRLLNKDYSKQKKDLKSLLQVNIIMILFIISLSLIENIHYYYYYK